MPGFLKNFVHLIGTILSPFSREESDKNTKYSCLLYVEYGYGGKLEAKITFKEKKDGNIIDFNKDYTGYQAVVQGFLTGGNRTTKSGYSYYSLEINGTDILISSKENTKEKISVSSNMVVTDDDVPF